MNRETMSKQRELQQLTPPLWTKTFVIITLCYFLLFLSVQMLLSPFPSYVKDQFQAGDVTVGLVTSLFALSAIASRFLTAALMTKIHRNVLLLTGIGIATVTSLAYPLADSVTVLLLIRVGFGVGFGMTSTIMPTLVSQIIPRSRIGEGIGYFGLSTSLAMSFGPIIGLSMMDGYGFAPLSIFGAIVIAVMVPLLFGTRSIPATLKSAVNKKSSDRTGDGVKLASAADSGRTGTVDQDKRRPQDSPSFHVSQILLPALLNMFIGITYGALLSFIALFGKEVHIENIGLFFLFNAASILIIRPISGRIFDRKGHAAVVIPGALLLFAGLTVLSFSSSLPVLIAAALLYGLGFGSIQPTLQAWMLRDSPSERHGTANSLYYNSTDLGIACGSMLLGAVASASSYAAMYRFSAFVMILLLVVYGIFLKVRTRKVRILEGDTAGSSI
jgi:MFS family permease